MECIEMIWIVLRSFFLVPEVIIPAVCVGIIIFLLILKFGKEENETDEEQDGK